MICLQSGGAIEGKIVELIGEYGALRVEQLQRYFSIEDAQMEKIIRKLVKKGRLVSDKENGYIKASEQKTSETKSSEEKISEKNTPAAATEKVRFEVGGGEYSDVICKRLLQAGLIDDADAFNKFLIQKDYDNLILPGVYDIPKGATYEEIAALLTTKVESETAQ